MTHQAKEIEASEPALILLDLPWPVAALSQNHRKKWETVAATKEARAQAKDHAKQMGLPLWPNAHLVFDFYPPNRRFDIQNVPGMLKAHIDGIADAMGCDDRGFSPHWPYEFGEKVTDGRVLIEITPGLPRNNNRIPGATGITRRSQGESLAAKP